MNFKKDETIYAYLKTIDSGPLLTRDQEEVLIKNVEVSQKQILNELISFPYSKYELKTYLETLESHNKSIVDISKKLDEESSAKDIETIELKFKSFLQMVDKSSKSVLSSILEDLGLTGTIIHGVVTEIKKKHSKIIDIESKVKQIIKYFDSWTPEMVKSIRSEDQEIKSFLKKEYKLTDVQIANKLNEWNQIFADKDLISSDLNGVDFSEVKMVYGKICTLELTSQKSKNELITKNLRLVISRAKKFLNKGLEFEDLIQEGNLGLMKAVDKFDSSKKTKVSTYATWWIDQSIRRAISNKGKTVRVPTHIEWQQTKLNEDIRALTGKLSRPPSREEISEYSNIDIETLDDLDTRAQHEIGLEEEISEGRSLLELLPSEDASPSAIVEQKMLREKIREILDTLPPRTEKVIRLRYGIGELPDSEGMTLQEIADGEGITKQGIRVRECSGLRDLKALAEELVK